MIAKRFEPSTDNLTNATSLVFSVGGMTSGSTVEILSGTTVVELATASSTTTQVTVNAASSTGLNTTASPNH
ncbi:MAG: hypothetical protein U0930_19475 [Pirellulales bacterium]